LFGSKNLQNTSYKIEYDSRSMNIYFNVGGGCGGGGGGDFAAAFGGGDDDSCTFVSRT